MTGARIDPARLASAIWALLVGVFAVGSEALVISPLLADIARDLDTDIDGAGLSVSVYGLAVAITAPLAGPIGDRISRRTTVLLGLAIFAVAGAACAVAPTLWALLAGRAACGLGSGLFLPAAYAWVGDEVPYADRGRMMGRVVAGWAAALVIGVPLGGFIGQFAGWREALAALAALALIAAVVSARLLPAGSGAPRLAADERVGLGAALRIPGVLPLLAVNLLDMLAFYGIYTYLGSFIREELDVRSGVASALILAYGVGVAAISLNGRLFDRLGKARALAWSLAGLVALFALLPWIARPVPLLVVVLAATGVCQASFLTCMTTLLTRISAAGRGSVVALMSCTTYIGVTLGAATMGAVFEGPGYGLVGGLSAGLAGLALALFVAMGAHRDESPGV